MLLFPVFVLPETKPAGIEVCKKFTFVYKAAASVLVQLDVPHVDVGIESGFAASEKLARFLDGDKVVW